MQSSIASEKSVDDISILLVKSRLGIFFSSPSISIKARLNSLFILSLICKFNSFSCFDIIKTLPDFILLKTADGTEVMSDNSENVLNSFSLMGNIEREKTQSLYNEDNIEEENFTNYMSEGERKWLQKNI